MTQGLSIGISSFLEGYLKGQEMKERRGDKKRQDERQTKLDEYRAQQEVRAIEAHDWRRSDQQMRRQQFQFQTEELERQRADELARKQAGVAAIEAADADFRAASAPVAPQAAPSAASGPGFGAVPPMMAGSPEIPQDQAPMNFMPQGPQAAPQQAKAGQAMGAVLPGSNPAPAAPPAEPKPPAGLRISEEGLVLPPVQPEGYVTPPSKGYEWGMPGSAGRDIDRAGHAVGNVIGNTVAQTGEAVVNTGVDLMQRINAPFRVADRWITGKDHIGAPEPVDLNGDGKSQTALSPATDFLFEKQPVEAGTAKKPGNAKPMGISPAKVEVADAATDVLKATVEESPALKAATKASKSAALGASKDKPVTEPQRQRAAKTWIDSYLKVGVPLYERDLLKQGLYDDAKALREWAGTAQAQRGMQAWGQATFAAQAGDIERAVDLTLDIINTHGYADYGYDVLKDQSEIIRDEAGEPAAIRLMLRNQQNGETFPMEDDIAGFIANALYMTNPEAAFEQENERQKAMAQAMIKAEEERRKATTDLITGDYDNANKAALELFKTDQANAALEGRAPLTWQEAQAAVSRPAPGPVRAGDDVPVMRPN